MKHIDYDASAEITDQDLFDRTEAQRSPTPETSGALAFQIAAAALTAWPDDVTFDRFSARLIGNCSVELADTVKLREIAAW